VFHSFQVLQAQLELAYGLFVIATFDQYFADFATQFGDLGMFLKRLSEFHSFSSTDMGGLGPARGRALFYPSIWHNLRDHGGMCDYLFSDPNVIDFAGLFERDLFVNKFVCLKRENDGDEQQDVEQQKESQKTQLVATSVLFCFQSLEWRSTGRR
jgi:hypothetical protein